MKFEFMATGVTLDFWPAPSSDGPRLVMTYHTRGQESVIHEFEPEQVWALFVAIEKFLNADMVWGLVRDRMNVKLYTLDTAGQILAEQECTEEGHELDQHIVRADAGGKPVKEVIVCTRCSKQFSEVVPSEVSG